MKTTKGVTLIEVLIAGVIVTGLVLAVASVMQSASKTQNSMSTGDPAELLSNFWLRVVEIGRAATACQLVVNGLSCDVDLGNPPTGVLSKADFILSAGTLEAKTIRGGVTTVTHSLENTVRFDVCDDTTMTNGTCAVPSSSAKLNARHALNLTLAAPIRTPANRFFRFRIETDVKGARHQMQGAFFIRSPVASNLNYLMAVID